MKSAAWWLFIFALVAIANVRGCGYIDDGDLSLRVTLAPGLAWWNAVGFVLLGVACAVEVVRFVVAWRKARRAKR